MGGGGGGGGVGVGNRWLATTQRFKITMMNSITTKLILILKTSLSCLTLYDPPQSWQEDNDHLPVYIAGFNSL